MSNTDTNYNPNNSSARSPDAKEPAPVSRQSGPNEEIINQQDAADKQSSAIQAEREWLQQVSQNPEHSARNNKIRLVSSLVDNGTMEGKVNTGREQVVFHLTPEISESKQVIYAEISDIREAASMLIYGGSPSRNWSINAKFLSRTQEEADANWKSIQLLKSWANPDKNYKYGFNIRTPRVLRLYGYGRTWQGIPVVIRSLNVEYPSDVDYIPAAGAAAGATAEGADNANMVYEYNSLVPIIQSVSFNLTEIRTPKELFEDYDLEKFKLGVLPTW